MSPRLVRLQTGDGKVVCERCELADRWWSRARGLLGRDALDPGTAMLLTPAPSVHTMLMRFPIDVVFVDRANAVVKVVHGLRPWRVAGALGARAVVELPAGAAAAAGLEPGVTLLAVPLREEA